MTERLLPYELAQLRAYAARARAHCDEGGRFDHRNAVEFLGSVERLLDTVDYIEETAMVAGFVGKPQPGAVQMSQTTTITITVPGAVQPVVNATVSGEPDPTPAPTPTPDHESRDVTVFDFGAVGDGSTDDGPAFSRALVSATSGLRVCVPNAVYLIKTPILVEVGQDCVQPWGLFGTGRLVSGLAAGQDLLTVHVTGGYARNFHLTGLGFRGNKQERNGVVLSCTGKGWSQNEVGSLTIENFGGDGLTVEGYVFESDFAGVHLLDCLGHGVVTRNLQGKNVSSLRFYGLNIAQVGGYGVLSCGWDASLFSAPQDTRFYGGYARQCGQSAMRFYAGGYLHGFNFENNCLTGGDAHVTSFGMFQALGVRGDVSLDAAKSKYLFNLSASGNHLVKLAGCEHHGSNWKTDTAKLAKLAGDQHTIVDECYGDFDYSGSGGWTRYLRGVRTTN